MITSNLPSPIKPKFEGEAYEPTLLVQFLGGYIIEITKITKVWFWDINELFRFVPIEIGGKRW